MLHSCLQRLAKSGGAMRDFLRDRSGGGTGPVNDEDERRWRRLRKESSWSNRTRRESWCVDLREFVLQKDLENFYAVGDTQGGIPVPGGRIIVSLCHRCQCRCCIRTGQPSTASSMTVKSWCCTYTKIQSMPRGARWQCLVDRFPRATCRSSP